MTEQENKNPVTEPEEKNPDWDRHEWSGEGSRDKANPEQWSDTEWAGEAPVKEPGTVEGGAGPTGGGHTPGEASHWAPEKK